IEGNTDERGTAEYNLALGERRAKAAMSYLVSKGIAADRMTTVSFGKERPVCTEHNESCWARNRRDDFLTKSKSGARSLSDSVRTVCATATVCAVTGVCHRTSWEQLTQW